MATVVKKAPGDTEAKLIAKFRRRAQDILTEVKDREFYESPSEKRKRKRALLKKSRRKRRD